MPLNASDENPLKPEHNTQKMINGKKLWNKGKIYFTVIETPAPACNQHTEA